MCVFFFSQWQLALANQANWARFRKSDFKAQQKRHVTQVNIVLTVYWLYSEHNSKSYYDYKWKNLPDGDRFAGVKTDDRLNAKECNKPGSELADYVTRLPLQSVTASVLTHVFTFLTGEQNYTLIQKNLFLNRHNEATDRRRDEDDVWEAVKIVSKPGGQFVRLLIFKWYGTC